MWEGFIWNPSSCECECDESCDIGEYLNYKSCKCRNKTIGKLLEDCSENIDGRKMLFNKTLNIILLNTISFNDYKKLCGSWTLYTVFFAVYFITKICIFSVFINFYWYFKKDNICVKLNPSIPTTIY